MEMVVIRFLNEDDRTQGAVQLGKIMSVIGLRGGIYVIPESGLALLDEWGCSYNVLQRGASDVVKSWIPIQVI